MSALPSQALSTIDLSAFIPAAEAAERLGRNRNAFTRTCAIEYAPVGKAFKIPPASGQAQWLVHRSIDPRLAGDGQDRGGLAGMEALTGKQRDRALQKADCARRYRHERLYHRDSDTGWFTRLQSSLRIDYPNLGTLAAQTLWEWERKSNGGRNPTALADRRGGHQAPEASAEAWKAFEDLYLHQNQPTARQVWKLIRKLAAENGWQWVSYSRCRKLLNRKIPPEKQAFHRTPEIYRKQLAPYIPQHEESWRAGQLWISDHKQLDLWCCWRGTIIRPWLTVWMDWRTRRIVGWMLSDSPNSSTILGSFRMGMKDPANCGGPAEVRIDNGKDFASYVFHGSTKQERRAQMSPGIDEGIVRGIYAMLSIAVHFAQPYGPNGKSRCERFFGDLASFARLFDEFCGINSETKPDRLAEILANPAGITTFEAAQRRLGDFIDGYNNNADHQIDDLSEGGVKLSPNSAFARWCDTRRVMADPAALDLLLAHWHKPVTVGRNGISLTIGGRVLHYGHVCEALRPFKALHKRDRPAVNVSYDPSALESVRVYDSQFRFVAIAPMNRVGGIVKGMTRADHAETHRQMAAYRKSLKHQAEYSLTSVLTPEEQLANATAKRHQAGRQAAEQAAQPASIVAVQTPLDGQSKQLRKHELRLAIGGDSLSEPERRRLDMVDKLTSFRTPAAPKTNRPLRPDLLEQIYGRTA
jgi:transposase InsO family protein